LLKIPKNWRQIVKKLLAIEDEAESREMFLESMEEEGFEIVGAENGIDGIQKAKEHLPDLIICDIVLPGLDGYEVLSALRQNPQTAVTPFIFLTAKTTRSDLRRGMELGADDYISKPSTIEEILGAIAAQFKKQTVFKQWWSDRSINLQASTTAETDSENKSQSIFPMCPQLSDVFKYIEDNYHQGITLSDVAKAVGYAPAYLTDLVRRQTGKTVNRWIVKRRMVAAQSLLLETRQSIEQIAETVGYQNTGHFFRQFRQYYGNTPQGWRKAQILKNEF
jgi:YesN/AraC family two-component response regulator